MRKVKCLVRATERKMSVWRMETSDDRQGFETATNQTHPQGPLGARKCDVLGHPPFNKKFRFEI